MKKHTHHRYRLKRKHSIVGLVHAWFSGKCTTRDCEANVVNRYVDVATLEQSCGAYYLTEKIEEPPRQRL